MANMQINQYTAASTIDPVNDYFLIDPGGTGVYKKINRNTALGITGSPVGTTDTQTISNKTLGNTNSITIKDGSFTLNNTADTTKVGVFSLANNTTSTTRTYTMPNASVTLASLTGTETLTNKTITSPTINGGTIANATITIDSIAGYTTSTIVTVANMQISNGVIGSANAVTSTSIAAGAVTPNALVASSGSGWGWQTYTPTLTNVTVGNGTLVARYTQIGKLVWLFFSLLGGTTTAANGDISLTLPVGATTLYNSTSNFIVGSGQVATGGVVNAIAAPFFNASNANLHVGYITPSATSNALGNSNILSFTTGTGIVIQFQAFYESA